MALTAAEEAQTRELLAQQSAILSLADSEATIISKLGATKVNLSQLPSASSVADADILLIRQGTDDKSVAGSVLKSYTATTVPDASTTVKGIVELATNAETATGTDTVRAITPAARRADTATSLSDPTYADNSTKTASTNWVRGAMLAIATAAGFAIYLSANGYIKFPSWLGGFIIQWGRINSVPAGSSSVVSLPIAFPNAFLAVFANKISAGTTTTAYSSWAVATSLTQVTVYNGTAATFDHFWLGIGW